MFLPTPTLGERGNLYSNILRMEWVGSGFIDYFPISTLDVITDGINDYPANKISIYLNCRQHNSFSLFRKIVIIINNNPIIIKALTSVYENPHFSKAIIDKFIEEDNALFLKILKSVRVKGDDGKIYKIKVDYEKLAKKMEDIAFKPNRPSDLFETPYELVEAEPLPPIKESVQAAPAVQSVPRVNPNANDYDHQQGFTIVKHGKASYKVYAETRKRDNQMQITLEPLNDKTTLSVEDWQSGLDTSGIKWFTVYLDAKYHREPNVTEHYNDSASIKIAEVEEFSQKGTLGGTIQIPNGNGKITMLYNGAVTFSDNFQFKYFKTDKTAKDTENKK